MSDLQTSSEIRPKERWNVLVCSVECVEVQLHEVPTDDLYVPLSREGESRDGKEISERTLGVRDDWKRS